MKIKYAYIILVLTLISGGVNAQETALPKTVWNGYTQLRFSSNFDDINSFAVRRMKLWINSGPGFSEHWGFHLQTTLSSLQDERFVLQDVMAFYKTGNWKISMGQFVPNFGFQRFQPDYEIPLTERSDVSNILVPNGTLGVRDIGLEGNFTGVNENLQLWLGIFNGYGIQTYRYNYSGVMLTHKAQVSLYQKKLLFGYSLMFRNADQLQIPKVLEDTLTLSGSDLRYNLFCLFRSGNMYFQAEYIYSLLNDQLANGYYLLAGYNLGKSQFVLSWNKYNDLISTSNDYPAIHFGYNYAFAGDKLKVMLDNGVKVADGNPEEYLLTIQLQFFFN